jgi:hypothetical protein
VASNVSIVSLFPILLLSEQVLVPHKLYLMDSLTIPSCFPIFRSVHCSKLDVVLLVVWWPPRSFIIPSPVYNLSLLESLPEV